MARIILITGGSRSGKSRHAQALCETMPGQLIFLATATALDEEMARRITRHQADRRQGDWHTVEEPLNLQAVIRGVDPGATILLDCLTLWVGNLLHLQPDMDEDDIDRCAGELLATARNHQGTMVFVTNEVGMGIVPDNEMARRYRDLVGRCNQAIAAAADQVILVTCGMPITIKA
ncbi:MAG: bifunctional adenosylcobinamide kinase/adenosylcobinamide-phosphate guanylyltransferase [Deltaproteobacteria bacterium CG_4_10_14_3_um_filter_60_8]|nr:MAG: bifunctional adenosylcobinamide kinase/adenosylcobinamide-phosphate guanylyltransferase [Desulfobacterales bacterium CG2_30_60_27]PIY22092.1 MAG: bifunctional adenosylcobinamide kinase/adenosylcobinamide-phosphate guanylyltransferase [Deltaproteobacteria bacterium CG_4_10_14_3_um_filter_60_8]